MWRRSSNEIMSSNTISPLPKESDTPSENVVKKVGIWIIPNRHWSLLLTRFSNEGILKCFKKKIKMLWRKLSLLLFQQKRRLTQSTKQINQKPPIKH